MPIKDLPGLFDDRRPMITVDPNALTLLAFEGMLARGVSGAPVVNADGEIVANLSVSDLRCIQPEHLGMLALPVAEFVALTHGTTYLGYSQGGGISPRTSLDRRGSGDRVSGGGTHTFFAGSPRAGAAMAHAGAMPDSPRAGAAVSDTVSEHCIRFFTVRPTSTLSEVPAPWRWQGGRGGLIISQLTHPCLFLPSPSAGPAHAQR